MSQVLLNDVTDKLVQNSSVSDSCCRVKVILCLMKFPQTQSEAWHFINSLSVDDILSSLPPGTVQYILSSLPASFQDCAAIPLCKIKDDPTFECGWKLLLLLPIA